MQEVRKMGELPHARWTRGGFSRRSGMRSTASRRVKTDPLEREIEAALQPGRFIRYGDAWSFADALNRLERKIAKLALDAPARAVALYETFLAGSYAKVEGLHSSSGGSG